VPPNTGVQSINNVFHIDDKVENVGVNKYIFDLIDNVEYVVYALYSRILIEIRIKFKFDRLSPVKISNFNFNE
jgi:hypothetical protein